MEIPFVGPSYNLESRPSGVQRTVNLEPVPQEPGNERTAWTFEDVDGLVQAVADDAWVVPPSITPMYLFHFETDGDEFTGPDSIDLTGGVWDRPTGDPDATNFKFGASSLKVTGDPDEVLLQRTSVSTFLRNGGEFCMFDGWLYVDSAVLGEGDVSGTIVRIPTETGVDLVLQISTSGGGRLSLFPQDDGTTPAQSFILLDEWFHVRANFYNEGDDSGSLYLWINGDEVDATSFSTTGLRAMTELGPDFQIGPFSGFADFLRIDEAYGVMGTPINEDETAPSFDVPTEEWPNP